MTSSVVTLLVDDSDTNRIHYLDGDWKKSGSFYEHSSTTHALENPGAGSFQFSFNGTEVSLYGTLPPANNTPSAAIDCIVDDVGSTQHFQQDISTTAPIYRVQYCSFTNLSDDEEHTLQVSVNASTSFFFLDYILYDFPMNPTSSLNAVPPGAFANVVVDDTSAAISYGGSWTSGGSPAEYNSTTHSSSANQATATIQFNGTRIQVYGTVGPDQVTTGQMASTYSIDSSQRKDVQAKHTALSSTETAEQLLLYDSSALEEGNHTLAIEVNTSQGKPLYVLDYIVYIASPTFGIFSESPAPVPTTSSGTLNENQPHPDVTKIIIPVIVVPVILLILCLILGLRYRKQRKQRLVVDLETPSRTRSQPFIQSSTSELQVISCPPHHSSTKATPGAFRSRPSYYDEGISTIGASSTVNSKSEDSAPPPDYYSAC